MKQELQTRYNTACSVERQAIDAHEAAFRAWLASTAEAEPVARHEKQQRATALAVATARRELLGELLGIAIERAA